MHHHYTSADIALLRSRIDIRGLGECWPWTGSGNGNGYGNLRLRGRKVFVHRMALEIAEGRPLEPGEMACHTCDNRPCCNPAHLFRGDHAANTADMMEKGRSASGERHGGAKLSDAQVRLIRERYATRTVQQQTLAAEYRVSVPAISEIVRGVKRRQAGGPILEKRIRINGP